MHTLFASDLRMSISNDSVKTDLVQIGRFELQHLVDSGSVDLISCLSDFDRCSISSTKAGINELLAILVEKVECW